VVPAFTGADRVLNRRTADAVLPRARGRRGVHHGGGESIYVSRELPRDEAIQDAMQRVAAALETRIRAKPHLWYAFYPYWEASAVTAS